MTYATFWSFRAKFQIAISSEQQKIEHKMSMLVPAM